MALYGYKKDGTPLKTQWQLVLYHLQETKSTITAWQAIKDFGFTRLAMIVKEIEYRTGIVLKRRDLPVKTRYGATVYITEYWYEESDK